MKIDTLIEEYLHEAMHAGIIRDMDNLILPPEFFPDIVVMLMNEEISGRLASGLVGYTLALGHDISEMEVMIPRSVSIACLDLLRPYAIAERPDLMEIVSRCDAANNRYLQGKDIEESGATNVTQLH